MTASTKLGRPRLFTAAQNRERQRERERIYNDKRREKRRAANKSADAHKKGIDEPNSICILSLR